MKLLQELILVAAAAIGGYILYKLVAPFLKKAGDTADNANKTLNQIQSTLRSWTPSGIAGTIGADISSGAGAVYDTVFGPDTTPANSASGNTAANAGLPYTPYSYTGDGSFDPTGAFSAYDPALNDPKLNF